MYGKWTDVKVKMSSVDPVYKKSAKDKRKDLIKLGKVFENKSQSEIKAAYNQHNFDLKRTTEYLSGLDLDVNELPNPSRAEIPEEEIKIDIEEFPQLSVSKDARKNHQWEQVSHENNKQISLPAVKNLEMLLKCFSSIEDTSLIEQMFEQYGGNYDETLETLKTIYPGEYNPPKVVVTDLPNLNQERIVFKEPMENSYFEQRHEEMKRYFHVYTKIKQQCKQIGRPSNENVLKLKDENYRLYKRAYDEIYMEIFRRYNINLPKGEIDLHELRIPEALNLTERYIAQSKSERKKAIHIITGQGKNSETKIPKILPAVEKFLHEKSIRFTTSEGRVHVKLF